MGRYNSPPPPRPIRAKLWLNSHRIIEECLRRDIAALTTEVERLNTAKGAIEEGFKVSRDAAFAALDSERHHMQRIGHGPQPVATYMLLMEHYLLKARDEWACSKKPVLDELDNLRKVGALVVACLEAHGAPPRVKSKANPIEGQPEKHAPR